MKDCPRCKTAVDGPQCPSCRYVEPGAIRPSERGMDVPAISSRSVTPQQWYNVCKHFPSVAARASRSLESVGPSHPLDATSQRGPLFGGTLLGSKRMRQPGEDDE